MNKLPYYVNLTKNCPTIYYCLHYKAKNLYQNSYSLPKRGHRKYIRAKTTILKKILACSSITHIG